MKNLRARLLSHRAARVGYEILWPDLRFRGTLGATDIGIDAFKRYFEQVGEAFPDLRADIHELLVADDAVVARVTWSGTHAGQLLGIPATVVAGAMLAHRSRGHTPGTPPSEKSDSE